MNVPAVQPCQLYNPANHTTLPAVPLRGPLLYIFLPCITLPCDSYNSSHYSNESGRDRLQPHHHEIVGISKGFHDSVHFTLYIIVKGLLLHDFLIRYVRFTAVRKDTYSVVFSPPSLSPATVTTAPAAMSTMAGCDSSPIII